MKKLTLILAALLLTALLAVASADTLTSPEGWQYTIEKDGTACLRGYVGDETRLTLPAALDGIPVISIGKEAFKNNVSIQSVVIPDNYIRLGAYAFEKCTRLASLVISGSIQEWGTDWGTNAAFRGCVNLFDVSFGQGLTTIGSYAFQGCTLLDTAILPDTVVNVGECAFMDCELLDIADLYGDIGNEAFRGCAYMSQITLHNATTIGKNAFRGCTSFKSIQLPDTLVSIGGEAFRGCSKLQSLTIPASVTSIAYRAFYDCKQLQSLELSGSVQEWPEDWGESKVFAENPSLAQVTLLPGIKRLPQGAFFNCDSLTAVSLPEGLVRVGESAFEGCDGLQLVDFPATVQAIDSYAFKNDAALSAFTLPHDLISIGRESFMGTAVTEVVIPDKATDIGYRAFKNCASLQRLVLGASLTNWGEDWGDNSAFANCGALRELIIENGVNSIGSYAFQNCASLQAVEVPSSAVAVRKGAFLNCTGLKSAIVYRGEIGDSAFENCSALESLTIRKVTAIGASAFSKCASLRSVDLPRTLLTLGRYAFEDCSALDSIVLPDSLTWLGAYAFRRCVALRSAFIGNNIGTWDSDWGTSAVFGDCVALEYVSFENLGTTIGDQCFRGCTALKGIYLPASILNIPGKILENAAETVILYGAAGTAAETFAAEHGFAFTTDAFPYGF